MLFNSREFLLFLPVVLVALFVLPHRFRWMLLLSASFGFYMAWQPQYGLLLLYISVVTFSAGLLVARAGSGRGKRYLVAAAIIATLSPLLLFKYFDFLGGSLNHAVGGAVVPALDLVLPVGISFFTFQGLGYVLDVARKNQPVERHFGHYTLYVSYFPQLVAGPIERAHNLLPQLKAKHGFEAERVWSGLRLMLWGFVKKAGIADNLSGPVNAIYADPSAHTGLALIIATVFFGFQIYCDFSGYTDIARGIARMMGIELMRNFDRPYGAASIVEFWRRWHISLTTWFRDYVYIPLGGNRVALPIHVGNIMIVFLLSGLWHGANWTFVVWGALHGGALIAVVLFGRLRKNVAAVGALRLPGAIAGPLAVAATFAFVSFCWIFFRAQSIDDAFYVAGNLTTGLGGQLFDGAYWSQMIATMRLDATEFVIASALVVGVFILHQRKIAADVIDRLAGWRPPIRWAVYYALVFLILFAGQIDEQEFIYFQF